MFTNNNEYLISIKPVKNKKLEASMYSIRNDFQLIIKNSSSLLPDLINRILIQTDYVQVPETLKFPYLNIFDINTPNIDSFSLDKAEEKKMPAIIKYTTFGLDSAQ